MKSHFEITENRRRSRMRYAFTDPGVERMLNINIRCSARIQIEDLW